MASIPEVRGVMSHVGRPDDGTDVTSFFNLEFNVPLKPMEEWRTVPILGGLWHRTVTREEIQLVRIQNHLIVQAKILKLHVSNGVICIKTSSSVE